MAFTYYVSTSGSDSATGLTELLAFQHIDKAMNVVAAGDKVYVKADGNYAELATIDTVGTVGAPIVLEGYTGTPGDGGRATITGSSSRANCITDSRTAGTNVFYVFKNFRFTAATGVGVLTDCDYVTFKNCKFDTNGTHGLECHLVACEGCEFTSNTTDGCLVDAGNGVFVGCKFYSNGGNGLTAIAGGVSCVVFAGTFFSNAVNNLSMGGVDQIVAILDCTIDGDANNSDCGIRFPDNDNCNVAIVNTVLYDNVTGLQVTGATVTQTWISRNNLVNANGTAYAGGATFSGEVTSAPQFTNEVGGANYTPAAGSPLINAGLNGG